MKFFRPVVLLPATGLALTPLAFSLVQAAPKPPARITPGPLNANGTSIQLHNGWKISPVGTRHETMGDLLLGGVLSPDGKWLAFVNGGGADHQVHLADTSSGKVIVSLPVERAQSSGGVAFSPDGNRLYVSGANAGQVYVFEVGAAGTLAPLAPLVMPQLQSVLPRKADPGKDAGRDPFRQDTPEEKAYLGGLAISPDGATLYLSNLAGDSVYALDAATGAQKMGRKLGDMDRPAAVAMAPDGKTLYVALWGGAKVLVLDGATLETRATIRVGSHPNALLLSRDGAHLFVSCGNDDSVYSLDTATKAVREKMNMRLTPRAPAGATPSALALSPDQKTLYVANSDNNDVAVVDVSVAGRSRVEGFIPTAWYPTFVVASNDGKRLFIGNGKGFFTGPNDKERPINPVAASGAPYILELLRGVLSTVSVPDAAQLSAYTRQVYANSPYSDALLDTPAGAPKAGSSPIPSSSKAQSPIKHILYIIKENRTYDQVLGDLKNAKGQRIGNGDPALTLFDEQVTPNHHALAREFVALDNLYANGEVSVDGHHWSNGAYVPDSMQRTWPSSYGGKGAPPIRYGDSGDPLSETPNGRIWDLCERAGLSFRTYYSGVDKRRSEEWAQAKAVKGQRDFVLADVFLRDVAQWEKTGEMPSLMVMSLGEDHTQGTKPGAFTPKASVASNDLALGKIVEGCSRSRFWKNMAIFVIEDDAQNGPDHVDAHRTVALVASPYTRRRAVDSTFYSTCSLLKTMELVLGLPPMSQYDAAATPLYNSFTSRPDFTGYICRPARIDLNTRNLKTALGAKASLALDFSAPDQLTVRDEDTLNRVLWHSIKGADVPYPGIVRRPLFNLQGRPVTTSPHRKEEDND
jgi:YVTN family beta-propeller protein